MTTIATKSDKRNGISEELRVAAWNVRGLANKEEELLKELQKMRADIAIISETKKKLKGTKDVSGYILFYSGLPQNYRAASGVAILMHEKFRNRIHSYNLISDRIINVRFRISRGYISLIGLYAPEEGKKEQSEKFYSTLQEHIDSINKNDYIIIGGDINARIGNKPVKGVVGINGEATLNENGKMLINFAVYNELKITNSFFKHKNIHKFTWAERGLKYIIDYILVSKKLTSHVKDTRAWRSYDISSDHYVVISEITLTKRWYNFPRVKKNPTYKEHYKINLLQDDSIRRLFCQRLTVI